MDNNDKRVNHPSFGMIQFSHRSGNPKLFGSAIDTHYNYVTVSIKTCELLRGDSGDYYNAPMHGNIVEVHLSPAQFAQLLTTANIGAGVPCTIGSREGKVVESPPDLDSQTENIRSEFKAQARKFANDILAGSKDVEELLKKPTLNKADRSKIQGILNRVAMELGDNMPFMVEMYQEATEKVDVAQKAEIEAFYVGAIRQAGLAALAAGQVTIEPPQLPVSTTVVETKSDG